MKTIKVEKPYSWLQWPVRVKSFSAKPLHVTAKFFGHAEICEEHVRHVLRHERELCTLSELQLMTSTLWSPEIFNDLVHVLELTAFPPTIHEVHNSFWLIKDQFTPYRPHITVPKEYWQMVKEHGLTPASENLLFGELELCLGVE